MPAFAQNLSKVKSAPARPTVLALAIAASFSAHAQSVTLVSENSSTALVSASGDAEFRSLGIVNSGRSNVEDYLTSGFGKPVSADGRVVVGTTEFRDAITNNTSSSDGFRWSTTGAYQSLGSLGGNRTTAYLVSADGSTVAGTSRTVDGVDQAFRWTASGNMVGLGTFGTPDQGFRSYATDMSADGTVVVGTADVSGGERAFRWTQAVGLVDLGTLGGDSKAYGVSADGSTVVGESATATSQTRAFRWSVSDGSMTNLGVLGGDVTSMAYGASKTGDVVFGTSQGVTAIRAFRWTASGGMESLGTLGGNYTFARAMTPDGSVLVGNSRLAGNNETHAFRWSVAGGMADLGTLGGTFSAASDLSDDGKVVVGFSNTSQGDRRVFRWTPDTGMQSLTDLLLASGVAVADDWRMADGGEAAYTNATGTVIVGEGVNPEGVPEVWLARVGPFGSGAVSLAELQQSLGETAMAGQSIVTITHTVLNGSQSRPLDRRVAVGKKTFWAAGDWGTDDHGERDGSLGLAELGLGYNLGPVQINGVLGQTWSRQNTSLNGLIKSKGTYLSAEALVPLTGQWWATFTATGHQAQADLRRAYLNAGTRDTSVGDTDLDTWALRARAEWDKGLRWGAIDASPYVDLSYAQTQIDGYTEVGGGFPARFDARKEKSTELRLGVNLARPLSNMALFGTAEVVHRFERLGARSSGEVLGLFAFDLEGVRHQQTWLRTGLGLSGKLGGGTATATLNLTTQGEAPSAWLGVRWQIAF